MSDMTRPLPGDIPWEQIQQVQAELITAAQQHDLATRPWGNWTRVPNEQVRRLLEGALRYLDALAPTSAGDGCNDAAGSEVAQVRKEDR